MKTLLATIAAVAMLGAVAVYGQAANPPGQNKKDEAPVARDLAKDRAAVKNARDLAKAGNDAGVEAAVAELNVAKKNSPEWHLETAQRLVQTAEELAREGDAAQVEKLVKRALQQLKHAEAKGDDATQAAAHTLAGFLHERYLADEAAAIASYEAAARLRPEESRQAKEAAGRLRKSEENRRNKTPDQMQEKIDEGDPGQGGRG